MEIIRFREHIAIIDNNREDREPERRRYMKKKSINDTCLVRRQSMELVLHILGGQGIDVDDEDQDGAAVKRRRYYCACVAHWMEPDKGYYTREAQATWNNPGWNKVYCIPVIDYIPGNYGFLYVEVARLYSETDPGTSSGTVIVGRAKVPLPREPYKAVEGWFELVRPSGDGHMCFAGNIILRMELRGRYI